jgi:hypothetical protein
MRSTLQIIGRLGDRLLSRFVPEVEACACTSSNVWCCDAAGDCAGLICWTECCCNRGGRLCCRQCSEDAGAGNVSCGGWSCLTSC